MTHTVTVEQVPLGKGWEGVAYRATCRCGWISGLRSRFSNAEAAGLLHAEDMA